MLLDSGIIKLAMKKRRFKHRRAEDQFSIQGEYARQLQFVYSREYSTQAGVVVDLIYFAADMLAEQLVIGFYRENPKIENGIYINTSASLPLQKFNTKEIDRVLDRLIAPVKDTFK